MSQSQTQSQALRTEPFDYVTSVGESLPTVTERRIARRLQQHRRLRKVTWRTYTRRMRVSETYSVEFDRILMDDVREIVDDVAPEQFEVYREENNVFIQNTLRER